ncbi:MAG: hypothetical protein IPN63_06790 [Gammaproteobacteria bacterium]|nr:hypothetical protein [Gammaproteobacteria bacterium]
MSTSARSENVQTDAAVFLRNHENPSSPCFRHLDPAIAIEAGLHRNDLRAYALGSSSPSTEDDGTDLNQHLLLGKERRFSLAN